MKVSDLLTTKGREVATIPRESSITEALGVLKERRIGAIVVTGETPPLVGILSERDIVRALATTGADTMNATVGDLMTGDVTVCAETTSLTSLMGLMTDQRIRHVPVVSEGQLVGLVSIGDVVKARFDELEHDKRDLLEYVSAR